MRSFSLLRRQRKRDFRRGHIEPLEARTVLTAPAFPGAEGFGAVAIGGRGGDVYHVTNLSDSGAGSLRDAIDSATGPRTIVFDVAGTITLESDLRILTPYLTIAGQTAPGDGITLRGHTTKIQFTHDIIVRFIRFRAGDLEVDNPDSQDSLDVNSSQNVILDHVSASWGIDETLSASDNTSNLTVQWSIIAEGLRDSLHSKGEHSMGSIMAVNGASLHHNLYAHNNNRNPRMTGQIDLVNNVIYDWGSAGSRTGDETESGQLNIERNYYLAGPSTTPENVAIISYSEAFEIWRSGDIVDTNRNGMFDGIADDFPITGPYTPAANRFDYPAVSTDDALTALTRVVAESGASKARDAADARIVDEVMTGTGSIIDSQTEVGGWPALNAAVAPLDTDGDGMPDEWENGQGLNAMDPTDGNGDTNNDGYTNLEDYLNSLVPTYSVHDYSAVASNDATVYGYSPTDKGDVNDGASSLLKVRDRSSLDTGGGGSARLEKSYIRFDLPANEGIVALARLELDWLRNDRGGITFQVFALAESPNFGVNDRTGDTRLDEFWSELDITYNNAPGNVDSLSSGGLDSQRVMQVGTFTTPNVPGTVIAASGPNLVGALNHDTNDTVTFILVGPAGEATQGQFASHESTTGHAPRLHAQAVTRMFDEGEPPPATNFASLTASDDASVIGFSPTDRTDENSGFETSLKVRDRTNGTTGDGGTARLEKSYIRFEIPTNFEFVTTAGLNLYWERGGLAGKQYRVYALNDGADFGANALTGEPRLDEQWDESLLTFNNAPGNVDSGASNE
ncbi:MAG: hypothetical protein KDA42_18360, partial [Planctomycetales bacterium]|nr:hypothetical protein [Planctomycetales bacterium]